MLTANICFKYNALENLINCLKVKSNYVQKNGKQILNTSIKLIWRWQIYRTLTFFFGHFSLQVCRKKWHVETIMQERWGSLLGHEVTFFQHCSSFFWLKGCFPWTLVICLLHGYINSATASSICSHQLYSSSIFT